MGEERTNSNMEKVETKSKVDVKSAKKQTQENNKKSKRKYIVLLFALIIAIIGYVIFRGEYLEILETGTQYTSIFWQNFNYTAITFGINFIVLFSIIYINNNRIKKALKPFFETEKKRNAKTSK